jgi:conjugal transfer mating pair stabilization protein TraG
MAQYTVYTFSNSDALSGLFNAVAAMVNANGFSGAIAAAIICGFCAGLLAMVFARDRLAGPRWLLSVTLIMTVLFTPRASVQLVDTVGAQPPVVVDNVPWGLAALAGVTTSMGNTLTRLYETAFQVLPPASNAAIPDSMNYSRAGMMFGARAIKASRRLRFTDPVTRSNMANFITNCTVYDIGQGFIDVNQFYRSGADLWALMATTNRARFAVYNDGITTDAYPCPTVYANLNARMTSATEEMMTQLGGELFPRARQLDGTVDGALARTLIEPVLSEAYAKAKIGTAVASGALIVRQNAIINSIQEASFLTSQQSNDPSAALIQQANAQALVQMNAAGVNKFMIATESLPLFRNSVEAIMYAIFPLIILLSLVFGGIAAIELWRHYVLVLVWLGLWAPLYAVVNYFATLAGFRNLAAASFNGGVTAFLNPSSANSIYSGSVNAMAITGELALAVPVIASAIVFGLMKMTGSLSGGLASAAKSADVGANTASTGNFASGNVNMDKLSLDSQYSSPLMRSTSSIYGTQTKEGNQYRFSENTGSASVSVSSLESQAKTATEQSTQAKQTAQNFERQASESTAASLNQALAASRSSSSGTTSGIGSRAGETSSAARQMQSMDKIVNNVAKELGISDAAAARALTEGSLGLMEFGMGAKQVGSLVSENKLSETYKQANASMKEAGISSINGVVRDYAQSEEFRRFGQTNNESARRIESGLQKSQSLSQSARASYAESEQYSRAAANMQTVMDSGTTNWQKDFNDYVYKRTGDDIGRLSVTEQQGMLRNFFASGAVVRDINGVPSILPYDGAGPNDKSPMRADDFSGISRQDAARASLQIGGREVSDESLTRTQAANDASVRRLTSVGAGGLPTEQSIQSNKIDRQREYDNAERDAKVNTGREKIENQGQKQLETSSTSKLGGYKVTDRVVDGISDKNTFQRAYGKGEPPPPGAPGPNPY